MAWRKGGLEVTQAIPMAEDSPARMQRRRDIQHRSERLYSDAETLPLHPRVKEIFKKIADLLTDQVSEDNEEVKAEAGRIGSR